MAVYNLQQQPGNLAIQRAFRHKYSSAKLLRVIRIVGTYVLAVGGPILLYYLDTFNRPNLKTELTITSSAFTFVAFWLASLEKIIIKLGAQIQEKFDMNVFMMKWNSNVTGDEPSAETIHNSSKKFRGKTDPIWYGGTEGIPSPYDTLIAQRSSVVWDNRLRTRYIWYLGGWLIALLIAQFWFAIDHDICTKDFLITIILPSLSAYIFGIRELREHIENRDGKKAMEKKIAGYILGCLESGKSPDPLIIRQYQDSIYNLRRCTALVWDWFKKCFNKSFEHEMNAAQEDYKAQILAAGGDHQNPEPLHKA